MKGVLLLSTIGIIATLLISLVVGCGPLDESAERSVTLPIADFQRAGFSINTDTCGTSDR